MRINDHRGRYSRQEVEEIVDNSREMAPHNEELCYRFLCEGVPIKQLGFSHQHVYDRVSKFIKRLEARAGDA